MSFSTDASTFRILYHISVCAVVIATELKPGQWDR